MEHLFCLLSKFSKDRHELTASILNPTDKQNFKFVLRMCDSKVLNLLRAHVEGSEATVIFLQIIRDIIDSHMDSKLSPLQRIRKIWYSLFLVRIWRRFIETSKKYTLSKNSLSANCYSCIELNAHNMVLILLHLKKINKPELFQPHLFSSQPCESIFRQLRSFTTTYSTVVNSTVKETLSRISKIHFQNEIMYATSPHFIYPRLKTNSTDKNTTHFSLPSQDQIFAEIEVSSKAAIATAKKIGLLESNTPNNTIFKCKIVPWRAHGSSKRKTKPSPEPNICKLFRAEDLKNIQLKDWSHKVNADDIDEASQYTVVQCDSNKRVIVKKTSLCWLLNGDYRKMSNDRLQRVRNPKPKKKVATKHIYPNPIYKPYSKQRPRHKFNLNQLRV